MADYTSEKEIMTENYLRDFDPWVYLEVFRTKHSLTEGQEFRYMLDGLHEVFSDGKSLVDLNFRRAL